MSFSHELPDSCQGFARLAPALNRRSAARFVLLLVGAILARGRRTVTSWIRAVGLSDQFRSCYIAVAAAGKKAQTIASLLVITAIRPVLGRVERLTVSIDDTPTRRYGPWVEGAGIHHNPTPGPAGATHVYGHVFVVLAILAIHPAWGVIALPLMSSMYIRRKDLPSLDPRHRPEFQTKLEMAVALLRWAKPRLESLAESIWLVTDGAYASTEVLATARSLGMTVVSRLRCDAALHTVPPQVPAGRRRRGRPRIHGVERISLSKRAGQRRGWTTETFTLYGQPAVKRYKTFLATWRPAGGVIRVVLVDEPTGWRAYFCTDPTASVSDILTTVANRFALEIAFRDVKEEVGAGKQQVRHLWASVGAFHICLWTFTLTELWAWNRPASELVDRSASPWDSAARRPSHADKRRAWRREILGEEIRGVLVAGVTEQEIRATAERLLRLAA